MLAHPQPHLLFDLACERFADPLHPPNAVLCPFTAYFVSFGPHGPRKPITASGQGAKTFAGVLAALGITTGVYYTMRANGKFDRIQPRFITKCSTCLCRSSFLSSLAPINHSIDIDFDIRFSNFRWRSCQDHDQGVARGFQPDRSRTEAEPHYRYCLRKLQGSRSRSVEISDDYQNHIPITYTYFLCSHHAPPSFAGRKDNLDRFFCTAPSLAHARIVRHSLHRIASQRTQKTDQRAQDTGYRARTQHSTHT